jgi:hypothetical protein
MRRFFCIENFSLGVVVGKFKNERYTLQEPKGFGEGGVAFWGLCGCAKYRVNADNARFSAPIFTSTIFVSAPEAASSRSWENTRSESSISPQRSRENAL